MKRLSLPSLAALVLATLLTSPAWANATFDPFIDVDGSLAADGFNELKGYRINAAPTSAVLPSIRVGIGGNVSLGTPTGGAIFSRTSGTSYPASSGLYEWGGPRSTFEFNVAHAATGLQGITLQSFINIDSTQSVQGLLASGNMPTLSFNGGSQFLAATGYTATPAAGGLTMEGDPQLASPNNLSYSVFKWDLRGISDTIHSFTLSFATDAHSNALAFQLDQVAAVPEPETYALAAIGLSLAAWGGWRRNRRAQTA